jgi:hypothetical protein
MSLTMHAVFIFSCSKSNFKSSNLVLKSVLVIYHCVIYWGGGNTGG